jgi:hypothetical protein
LVFGKVAEIPLKQVLVRRFPDIPGKRPSNRQRPEVRSLIQFQWKHRKIQHLLRSQTMPLCRLADRPSMEI